MTLMVGKNNEILNIEEMDKNPLKRMFKHKVQVFKNAFKDIITLSEIAFEKKTYSGYGW